MLESTRRITSQSETVTFKTSPSPSLRSLTTTAGITVAAGAAFQVIGAGVPMEELGVKQDPIGTTRTELACRRIGLL
jgi:hypothetical protein